MNGGAPEIRADGEAARANADLVAAFFREVLGTGDAARAAAFLAPDFVDRSGDGGALGPASVATKLRAMWAAFPDGRWRLDMLVAAGDLVAARSTFSGRQAGAFAGIPPTGRAVEASFSDFYRIADGRLVEHWHDFDLAGLLRQLGAGS